MEESLRAKPSSRVKVERPVEDERSAREWEVRLAERAAKLREAAVKSDDPEASAAPRRRGRPPLAEGVMTDVTLRVPVETLSDAEMLVRFAHQWPEFAGNGPTRAGVLKLAMSMGLQQLRERQSESEPARERAAQGWPKTLWVNSFERASRAKAAPSMGEPVTAAYLSSVIEGLIVQQRRQEVEMAAWRRQVETQMVQLRTQRQVTAVAPSKDRDR
jgi:hypothetical protein